MYSLDCLKTIPEHMRDGVHNYIMYGRPVGDFLTQVFSNSLTGAFARADEINTVVMRDWAHFLYEYCPSDAMGSLEEVHGWQKKGGLKGTVPELADAIGDPE